MTAEKRVALDFTKEGWGIVEFDGSLPVPGRMHVIALDKEEAWHAELKVLLQMSEDLLEKKAWVSPLKKTLNFRNEWVQGYYAYMSPEENYPQIEQNSLVVVMYPESELTNPYKLKDFTRTLQAALVAKRSYALVFSQSPFLLQEVPSRFVTVVDGIRGPGPQRPHFETFGEDPSNIAEYLFGMERFRLGASYQDLSNSQLAEALDGDDLPMLLTTMLTRHRIQKNERPEE